MQLKNSFIVGLLLFVCNSQIFGQSVLKEYHFSNNYTSIPDSLKNFSTEQSVFFFIPSYDLNQEDSVMYEKKIEELYKRLRIFELGDIYLHCFFFNQDTKSNANGILISNRNKTKNISVGQLECFFVNFDTTLIFRAQRLLKSNFRVSEAFKGDNFYNISIIDGNKCFTKIQERIPYYFDFIRESTRPTYTSEERTLKTLDSISLINKLSFEALHKDQYRIERKLDSIINMLNRQIFMSSGNGNSPGHFKK